jgi:ferric-dicitrate binding protein FerR (iron transport regulator)
VTASRREPDARTLAAFLAGECSTSEAAEVTRWAQSSPEYAARLDRLRATFDASAQPTVGGIGSWDPDQIWNAIAPRLDEERRPSLRVVSSARTARVPTLRIPQRRNVAGWATAAAAAILLIGVSADHRAARDQARLLPAPHDTLREYRTDRGQRASVTLPDGSAFQLGPLSVLRVPSGYGAPARIVELEGDGYFNVAHDARHPFSVRTARTTIHDVGTRFVVRARPTEQRIEVAVAEGTVSIEAGKLVLGAGQAAFVDEHGTAAMLPRASVASRFAWTHGEFVFDRVLVPDMLAELSRWYGKTFVLADTSLNDIRLTTTLRGETILEALVILETALDVDAHADGDTVTLRRHGKPEK